MNKTTRCVTQEEYEKIIEMLSTGYVDNNGVRHKPNPQLVYVLVCETNLGIRISDVLQLTLSNFKNIDGHCSINIVEKKTKKERKYTCPLEFYNFLLEYCIKNQIGPERRIFPITTRCVQKELKLICDTLNIEGIGSHSFRKKFAQGVWDKTGNILYVQKLLLHASPKTSMRYLGVQEKELEDILKNNVNIPLLKTGSD